MRNHPAGDKIVQLFSKRGTEKVARSSRVDPARMSEIENAPKLYGFNLDALTPEFLIDIVKIYQDSVGKTSSSQRFIEQIDVPEVNKIKEGLLKQRFHERRIGSAVAGSDSKLQIRQAANSGLYYFDFNPNFESNITNNVNERKLADEGGQKFRSKVNEFLISSGLGSQL